MPKSSLPSLSELENAEEFIARHIGIEADDEARMLAAVGSTTRAELIDGIVPPAIRRTKPMRLPASVTEADALAELKAIAAKNKVAKNFIGQGYYGTHTPGVILRNVLENPAWYTAYTPYQAEISQGRMEALVNFQTMVCDLTGMAIANASMLDEATAAAEAMTLAKRSAKSKSNVFLVSGDCHPQTIEVIRTRAAPLGIEVKVSTVSETLPHLMASGDFFGALAQYPRPPATCTTCARSPATPMRATPPSAWRPTCWRSRCWRRPANGMPTSCAAPRSASACRCATAARTRPIWPAATSSSARCPAAWWA